MRQPTARRVLVTGDAGFIGSILCERRLDEGHEVLCVDNDYTGRRATAHLLDHRSFEVMRLSPGLCRGGNVDGQPASACTERSWAKHRGAVARQTLESAYIVEAALARWSTALGTKVEARALVATKEAV